MISGGEDIGIAQQQDRPGRRAVDEAELCLKDGDAGALGADQCFGHVEAVFRQKVVQVVARHPAGDFRDSAAGSVRRSGPGSPSAHGKFHRAGPPPLMIASSSSSGVGPTASAPRHR